MVLSFAWLRIFSNRVPKRVGKEFLREKYSLKSFTSENFTQQLGEEEELYCTGEGKVSLKNFSTNNIVRRHLLGKWWLLLPFLCCDNSKEPFRRKSQ